MRTTTTTTTPKGPGLARGPALIVGAILAGFGLVLFLKAGNTPTGGFPDMDITGEKFLGFETNGWTAFFTTTGGVLLLFGAAQHLLAKTMSLLVGLALAACAILALVNGHVLGLAAANGWTELGWAIAAAVLLVNVVLPRRGKDDDDIDRDQVRTDRTTGAVTPARTTRTTATDDPADRGGSVDPDARRG